MTNITWKINSLKAIESLNNFENVVVEAEWTCIAENEIGKTSISGDCNFRLNESSFKNFNDLKEDEILNWCYQVGIDKSQVELDVVQKLNNTQSKPKQIILPWYR